MNLRTYTDPISGLEFEGLTDEWGNINISTPFNGLIRVNYNESERTLIFPAWIFQPKETMTLNECANYLGVTKVRVSRMCKNGTLKSTKVGNSLIIDRVSVERFRERNDKNATSRVE